jgi:hypothetical protein
MRWTWMLLTVALAGVAFSSPEARAAVRHLFPPDIRPFAPLLLLGLAMLAGFTALVLSSRGFGLLALGSGVGALWLQSPSSLAFEGLAVRLPGLGSLDIAHAVAPLLSGTSANLPGDTAWLGALALCALFMAGVLTLGTKVE